ncbi:MAG: hypothetical protein ACKVXR_08845 [Planctomycetota bacterium]
MSSRILFTPDPTRMIGIVSQVPEFQGDYFFLNAPESIGDANQVVHVMNMVPSWSDLGNGVWRTDGHAPGELDFVLTVTPGYDTLDVHLSLTNNSNRIWTNTLAFTCFNCGSANSLADHECARHWGRNAEQFKRLTQMRRRFGPRPTIQAYSVEGATPATLLPFVNNFQATPDLVLEPWLAIQTRGGNRLAGVVSNPGSFLFQNSEFSCIHSGPSFGVLNPGQTEQALTRVYLVRATLQDWYRRMKVEMGL